MRWPHRLPQRRIRRSIPGSASDVSAECEAFLAGRLHHQVGEAGGRVTSWMWLNVLAHGTEAELRSLDTDPEWTGTRSGRDRVWTEALAFLSSEILDAARDRPGGLHGIQQEMLVPLELRLARDQRSAHLGPSELAGRVLASLRGHPSTGFGRSAPPGHL